MEPKYVELTRILVKEIADGRYPLGSILPGEIELAEQHQVSRSTLRLAMQRLDELGLISRTKKLGTRVERQHPQHVEYSPHMSTLDELFEFHLHTKRTVFAPKEIVVDFALSDVLQCRAGERWMKCVATRHLNDEKKTLLSYSDVYVFADYIKGKEKGLLKTDLLINDYIAQVSGVTAKEIRQTISAVNMNKTVADFFQLNEGVPSLSIKRQHFDEGGKVYHVGISILPSDRFFYETVLTRKSLD